MASAGLASKVTGVLGSSWVSHGFLRATAGKVRILAYHGIADPQAFARHLDHLADLYHPVSGAEVIGALVERTHLPDRAVWVTFDDGRPEVVGAGLELLRERSIPATMYVCPGVLDGDEPYWWDVTSRAQELGIRPTTWAPPPGGSLTSALKAVPDTVRRAVVDELTERLRDLGQEVRTLQLTTGELRRWHDSGMEVGNHTWDHPLLDRCAVEEQRRQVVDAHEVIAAAVGAPVSFAYPNGNVTPATAAVLHELGYGSAVDFAHRLCPRNADPLRLPRLRIDTDAPLPRFRAVLSGAHSAVFAVTRADRHGDMG